MRGFTSSPYWLFFYSFFIISFVPYFVIRFAEQRWVYEILYRPNGIVENMTVLLYIIVLFFSGWSLFKDKHKCRTIYALFGLSIFMIGEEVRWGLGLLVDDLHDLYFTGFQDILFYAVHGIPERFPLFIVGFLFVVKILVFCALGSVFIAGWYYRHNMQVIKDRIIQYPFSGYVIVYGLLILGVIILELFIQPGPRKLDYIEETFELNAALLLVLLSYEGGLFKRIS